jgi:hypothetical protein
MVPCEDNLRIPMDLVNVDLITSLQAPKEQSPKYFSRSGLRQWILAACMPWAETSICSTIMTL